MTPVTPPHNSHSSAPPPTILPKPRPTSSLTYRTDTLDARRNIVVEQVDAREVPVDKFFETCLPPLRQGIDVDETLRTLKENGAINVKGRWSSFDIPPKDRAEHEDVVFKPMQDISEEISLTAEPSHGKPTLASLHKPNMTFRSQKFYTARPDGCDYLQSFPLTRPSERAGAFKPYFEQIASVREYKKHIDDAVSSVTTNIHFA